MYRSTSPPATRTGTPDLQPRPQRNRECPRLEIKYTEKKRTPHLTESCKNREFVSQSNGDPVGIRTLDLLIRSQSLYPAELPSHIFKTCLFYKIAFSLSR